VPQPYPQVATQTNNTESGIPWGLIGVIAITGIIAVAIIAIASRRKD